MALICSSGVEPEVIEYLKTPPTNARRQELIKAMDIRARSLLREKGNQFDELNMADPKWTEYELVDFTLLTRDVSPYLVDRYSERKQTANPKAM